MASGREHTDLPVCGSLLRRQVGLCRQRPARAGARRGGVALLLPRPLGPRGEPPRVPGREGALPGPERLVSAAQWPCRAPCARGPADEAPQLRLHDHSKNFADDELIAVSEAPRGSCTGARAGVLVVDCGTREVRQRMSVSDSRINCCDAAGGLVCLGGSDSKVRLLRRAEAPDGRGGTCGEDGAGYQEVWTHQCLSEVNDLRLAREGAVVTVRTGPDRCPAGMDLIPLDRPDALVSFQGGCSATMGKYIHALDGFEEGCSLSSVICAGEDAFTSAFSVMLFDFRRQSPGVVDLPVAALGQPPTSTVWPLRAGASHLAYAGMGRRGAGGGIAVVDFRYPTTSSGMQVCFPGELDDFRCFGGSLYAACTARGARGTEASVFRCSPSGPRELELLSSVVGAWPLSSSGQGALEDLKVLTVSQRGFALSCGEHLLLGSVAEAGRPGLARRRDTARA
ncbi:unnamed protein product [Prorocentrum cordatum]|uniref:Uncharacterized protein n=1 Tax=Prorocentrum cordatum TaxID=2364126 RepID=A0ABN9U7R9_9DINO|nr:unnamed protein product [Polarella glacialis]